jgi:hypothetical protein
VGPGARRAALWSATWAIGVAIGIALGSWVNAASGSGAPGPSSIDPAWDLVALPLFVGGLTFIVLFAGYSLVGRLRRSSSVPGGQDGANGEHKGDDGVGGVGPEIPAPQDDRSEDVGGDR